MNKYIAFSGGVESRTMCLLYGKGATAVFTDTGSEHKEMYKKLDEVEKQLIEIHGGDFKIIRLRAKVPCGDAIVSSVEEYALKSAFLPGKRERYCTRLFKIAPMDLFLADKGECTLMIGLNADEEREGNFGLMPNVNYTCPLQDDGLTREMCINLLKANNMEPNFPAYMKRGGGVSFVRLSQKKSLPQWFTSYLMKSKELGYWKKTYRIKGINTSVSVAICRECRNLFQSKKTTCLGTCQTNIQKAKNSIHVVYFATDKINNDEKAHQK